MSTVRWPGFGVSTMTFLALALLLALSSPCAASPQESEEGAGFSAAKGRVTYRVYCINCHGATAKGDGSLAELLTVTPADLTAIESGSDEGFPKERIYDVVDGRSVGVRGHGMKEMPVWGDVFQTSSFEPSGNGEEGEERAQRKIWEVVYYIESIQTDATAEGD